MSKVTKLAFGDRVQLIPFKHKGKQGVIKYIGEIEGKAQGNWVGIELDEAKGDCSGMFNDQQVFECPENHGIFLRPTQVKSLMPDKTMDEGVGNQSSIIKNDESMASNFFGSTLEKEGNTLNILSELKDTTAATGSDQPSGGAPSVIETSAGTSDPKGPQASDSTPVGRIKGWKERLEAMRK